jgi:hypothetical protein
MFSVVSQRYLFPEVHPFHVDSPEAFCTSENPLLSCSPVVALPMWSLDVYPATGRGSLQFRLVRTFQESAFQIPNSKELNTFLRKFLPVDAFLADHGGRAV